MGIKIIRQTNVWITIMDNRYKDREDAGEVLAELLKQKAYPDPVVLALPRGGVPLASIVAKKLNAPLDLILVRKIGLPGQQEVAAGAVVDGDPPVLVFNEDLLRRLGLTQEDLAGTIEKRIQQINERRVSYYAGRKPLSVEGKTAIIVDDGMATGATARAAVKGLRERGPKTIILAVPLATQEAYQRLKSEVDEIICPMLPEPFWSVGSHYRRFGQVSDEEVIEILKGFAA
jgi:putative phosphoribosyl transferase